MDKECKEIIEISFIKKQGTHSICEYKCYCGNLFKATRNNIRRGNTKSCGCLAKNLMKTRFKTHGRSKDPIYNAYRTMINRCTDKNHIQYNDYGGRGIRVSDRWLESFENFLEDMGERPKLKYQLDRIDNNGNYCKENCRWVSPKQNVINSSKTKKINYKNKIYTINELCSEFKMNTTCFRKRLRRGWDIEKALTIPSKNIKSKPELNEDKYK